MSSKSWQRPWSIEEIVQNASNWSLAGDAGLLKYLELFSENLLSNAETTNSNLNNLLSQLNNTSLSLDEVKNDFRSLRNTQFIESRVYEDDETVQGTEEGSKQDKQNNDIPSENCKIQDMKDAILAGIEVVENNFDKVEVPGSDSEDEADFPSFILKPKDPYADRPLPCVIGTDEWYKKWHVGLIDSSSDSEPDKVSEKFSESDSEDDLIQNKIINHPVANSTFNEGLKPDLFGASDIDDNSTSSYPSSANKNFANELAAKLGNFVDDHSNVEEEVNRRPISTAPRIQTFGNLFADEPPPIDDFVDNNNVTGLFSGGEGLFDDVDNSANLWKEEQNIKTENNVTKPKIPNLFEDLEDDIFNTISYGSEGFKGNDQIESIKTGGLFDDEDDGLFNNNNFTPSYLQNPPKVTLPFIADEPPEFKPKAAERSDIKSKKPIGGVKIMDTSNLFSQQKVGDILKQKRQSTSSSESDSRADSAVVNKTPSKKKTISLFDDDDEDDDFEKNLFASSYAKKEVKVTENTENGKETETPETVHTSALNTDFNEHKENKSFINDIKSPESKVISLFDEDDDDKPDDLFSDSLFTPKSQILNNNRDEDTVQVPPMLDSFPPELDDNWDSRSDNLFDDNDTGLFDNIPEMSSHRSGLFDNEPPSLFFESSGIVKDISTRAQTDESFTPYASSSRRYSSEIFNEQQSNDSFFVTKNEIQSNLDIIPETSYIHADESSESKIDITPSGVEDDLFGDSTAATTNPTENFNQSEKIILPNNLSNATESSPSKDSPGKLKHNLKINVNALIPGGSPPKKQTAEKIVSLEVPSTDEKTVQPLSLKSTGDPSAFENIVKDVEVLSSITKARAKIPFKRTPSTRRARQESLRKSVPDFKILTSNNDVNIDNSSISHSKSDEFVDIFAEESTNTQIFDNFLQPEDAFVEVDKEKIDVLRIAKKVVSVEEVPKLSVIKTDSFSSDNNKQLNLFDDSEDFDDIFSIKKLPPKSNILSKSLFENDFDDDDVFGTSSSFMKTTKPTITNKSIQKKPIMTAQVKKLENSEVVEDPLSSFLDE